MGTLLFILVLVILVVIFWKIFEAIFISCWNIFMGVLKLFGFVVLDSLGDKKVQDNKQVIQPTDEKRKGRNKNKLGVKWQYI